MTGDDVTRKRREAERTQDAAQVAVDAAQVAATDAKTAVGESRTAVRAYWAARDAQIAAAYRLAGQRCRRRV